MLIKIGQMLINKKLITSEQLEEALTEQTRTGELLGVILIKKGFLNQEDFLKVLSEQFNVPFIKLKETTIDPLAIKKVPAKFAWYYKVMPVKFVDNKLLIASSDPLRSLDDLRIFLGYDLKPALAEETEIMEAIKEHYGVGAETVEGIIAKAPKDVRVPDASKETGRIEDIEKLAEDASVVKLVNQIILEAYQKRATDIHIEPFRGKMSIRYRIDGVLYNANVPADIERFFLAIISRIKIMSRLNIVERRLPQDGRAVIKIGKEELDLRISIIPTRYGEGMVIRILPMSMLFSLERLGLAPEDLELLAKLIKKPHGIILVTGPTGSGKSTTLYGCLNDIKSSRNKIITIEDPIEYELEGITQIQVVPEIGFTFAQGLRSILRHDPDIMMVGEIRDFETAELAIRSALTGHLVFSTIHTNDAAGAVARLLNIGIEPYLAASSVEAFIAQRLVRLICPDCKKIDTDVPDNFRSLIGQDIARSGGGLQHLKPEEIKIYKGQGCKECNFTGYKGRTAIHEILVVDKGIRELMLRKASTDELRDKAVSAGMKTLRLCGWKKVIDGLTTPEEILRVTQAEEY
ncbi:MAG: ATPase, T2SS/T4P/T4SS family [Candidatus Omnitrophica bacterium]|jgi:type II secretory ATPase GspE/PulE/Tfp pilus assembly ATPase PilB-like protein|nr:ATPase, T2SS/T4P/T4SS family [Candidatus Omnitrophota bacterium]